MLLFLVFLWSCQTAVVLITRSDWFSISHVAQQQISKHPENIYHVLAIVFTAYFFYKKCFFQRIFAFCHFLYFTFGLNKTMNEHKFSAVIDHEFIKCDFNLKQFHTD